jgi:hypothetical protein
MKRLSFVFILLTLQYAEAAKQINSPDGGWSIQRIEKDGLPKLAIFAKGSSTPAIILHENLSNVSRVEIKWSADSTKVVTLSHFSRDTLIVAGWFDGAEWHKTVPTDNDTNTLFDLAKRSGSAAPLYRFGTAELGPWLAPDEIKISGTLRDGGYPTVSYSVDMQIVPGTYAVGFGGFAIGALKFSNYHIEIGKEVEASQTPGPEKYIVGQTCTLTGQLNQNAQGAWFLRLSVPISVDGAEPGAPAAEAVGEVILLGVTEKGMAYFNTILGKAIKVNGTVTFLESHGPQSAGRVGLMLSTETINTLEGK